MLRKVGLLILVGFLPAAVPVRGDDTYEIKAKKSGKGAVTQHKEEGTDESHFKIEGFLAIRKLEISGDWSERTWLLLRESRSRSAPSVSDRSALVGDLLTASPFGVRASRSLPGSARSSRPSHRLRRMVEALGHSLDKIVRCIYYLGPKHP
jgi:hypothetical protein